MDAPASPPRLIWNRALVWSEHDVGMARQRACRAVLICIGILVIAAGASTASYVCNQLVLAAMSPQAVPPTAVASALTTTTVPHTPACCAVPPIAWFPTW